MTDQKRARVISRVTTWILRILCAVTILFFLAVFLTATLGGHGEVQRQSLESVIHRLTGKPAHVMTLEDYQIFPNFVVRAQNIVVGDQGAAEPDAIVGRINLVQDTISNMVQAPSIEQIEVENLMTRAGVFGPYSLHILKVSIEGGGESPSVLVAHGTYGELPIEIRVPLERQGARVRVNGGAPVVVDLAGLRLQAVIRVEHAAVLLQDLVVDDGRGGMAHGVLAIPRGVDAGQPILEWAGARGVKETWRLDKFSDRIEVTAMQGVVADDPALRSIRRTLSGLHARAVRFDAKGKKLPHVAVRVEQR